MEKFTRFTAKACPIGLANLDTDQLLPARFLKVPRAAGFARMLFHDLRFDAEGREKAGFPLNQESWREAKILVAGRNFGGGSSREAAVYALSDYGIRCVIGSSFGDIFSQNAAKNGLLTAVVAEADAGELMAILSADPTRPVTVDLEQQSIVCGNRAYPFTIDPTRRARLLNGWDDIDLTNNYRSEIAAFRERHARRQPWILPERR